MIKHYFLFVSVGIALCFQTQTLSKLSTSINRNPAVDINTIDIPEFIPGESLLTTDLFIGTYNSVYLAFMSPLDVNSFSVTTYVYKLNGTTSEKSTHERPLLSYFPATGENEKNEELSYYWHGPSSVKEAMENAQDIDPTAVVAKYGMYNKNNGLPSFEWSSPSLFMKLVSDKSEHPAIWAIGPPPFDSEDALDVSSTFLYVYKNAYDGKGEPLYDKFNISDILPEDEEVYMMPSEKKDDPVVWIGAGKIVIKAFTNGERQTTDLSKLGATGSISKIRCKKDAVWILCGKDLFKIENEMLSKFCTINAPVPSFAVDNNYVFTNDGNKISLPFNTTTSLRGLGSLQSTLGTCSIECTTNPTERFLFALSVSDGKVYRIEK
jgi:hypothetical protein